MSMLRTQVGRAAMEAGAAQAFGSFANAGKVCAEGEAAVIQADGRRDKNYGKWIEKVYDNAEAYDADPNKKGGWSDEVKQDHDLVVGMNTYRAYSSHFTFAPPVPM